MATGVTFQEEKNILFYSLFNPGRLCQWSVYSRVMVVVLYDIVSTTTTTTENNKAKKIILFYILSLSNLSQLASIVVSEKIIYTWFLVLLL